MQTAKIPKLVKIYATHLRTAITTTNRGCAINLEYHNGDTTMNEEAFKKKWQDKYNTKFVGNGGFIISAQDNGKVKVTNCNLLGNVRTKCLCF